METENQEQPVSSENSTTPVESAAEVQAPSQPVNPSLNCSDCSGSGLINDSARCSKCLGTGKASAQSAEYPEGTQVVTQEGVFSVENGELVKKA